MNRYNEQRIPLAELCVRWRMDTDQILELALAGSLPLWIHFTDVFLQQTGTTDRTRKKKPALKQACAQIEVQPAPDILRQIQGRSDRMLIAAELPCLDADGQPVNVTNSVGEEWGETSMIGLQPALLYARLDDVVRCERQAGIEVHAVAPADARRPAAPGDPASSSNVPAHPWFAPELQIAQSCWQALFAHTDQEARPAKKASILGWLRDNHPDLSPAASERIARVVAPEAKTRA